MKELQKWMEAQLAEDKTEPNSGLGKAISYLLKHWAKLTLFLSQPGSPIDNNAATAASGSYYVVVDGDAGMFEKQRQLFPMPQ
jgi:Transposase IS66 family